MSSRKTRNEWEEFYAEMASPQDYDKPTGENGKFTKIYSYMLTHPNYIALSNRARTVLTYMKDWAYGSKEFRDKRVFAFSPLLLEKLGVMTAKICRKGIKELEHYGFIKKANNATFQSGVAQMWAFSNEWYKGVKPRYEEGKNERGMV